MSAPAPTSTARFTCRACRETFNTREEMKAHFNTELHKVNVGLRVENKAPITADQIAVPAKEEPATRVPEKAPEASPDSAVEHEPFNMDAVPEGACLFCHQVCDDLEANLTHMQMAHNFTLPAASRLTDKLGMVRYLQFKVWSGLCLWCTANGKQFRGLEGVQAHMRDTGHCSVLWLGEEDEYADFYDPEFINGLENVGNLEGRQLSVGKVTSRDVIIHKHRPAFTKLKNDGDEEEVMQRKLLMAAKAAHTTPGTLMKREEARAQQRAVHMVHERPTMRDVHDLQIATMIRANKLFTTGGRIGDN